MQRHGGSGAPTSLVGREAELAIAVDAVERAGQLLIGGEAGVGKSTLLGALADELTARGFRCVRATGTDGLAAHPMAALGHLVGPFEPDLGAGALTHRAVEALIGLAAGTTGVILVDDAQHLDPWSLHALHGVRDAGGPRVVVAARTGGDLPDAVTRFGRSPGHRLEIQRLSASETATLAADVLGAPLDTPSAERVHEASDGLPLTVVELLRAARACDAIVERFGLWRWNPDAAVDGHLADLLGLRVGGLGAAERDVLDLLSILDALPADVVTAVVEGADLGAMEEQRLLRADPRPGWVRPGHPLLRDAALTRLGPVRRHTLLRRLLTHLAERPAFDAELERRRVMLAVELDVPVEPEALLAVVRWGRAHGLWAMLGPTMARAWRDAPGPFTGLAHAEAKYWNRDLDGLEEVVERATDRCTNDAERVALQLVRARALEIGLGRHGAAATVTAELRRTARDPASLLETAAAEAELLLFAGDVEAILTIWRDAPSPPFADASVGAARYRLTQATVGALGLAGRLDDAATERTLQLSLAEQHGAAHPLALSVVEPWIVANELLGGRPDRVRGLLAERYAGALSLHDGLTRPLWALPCAIERWVAGDLLAAEHYAREAMGVPDTVVSIRRMAAHFLARVLESRGDHVAALELCDAASPDGYVGLVRGWTTGVAAICRRRLDDSVGQRSRATEQLDEVLAAADELSARGQHLPAAHVLHDAVRLGHAPAATDRLASLATRCDAVTVSWMAAHAAGLTERVPAALVDTAVAAAAGGAMTLARHLLDDALALAAAARDPVAAAAAVEVLDEVAAATTGWPAPALTTDDALDLSPRELDVARAAAAGLSDREIADLLVVSVRTVHAHLRAVYRKLGVEGRRDLRRIPGLVDRAAVDRAVIGR